MLGRMAWSSNATFLADRQRSTTAELPVDLQAAAGRAPAVGLPRRDAVPARGRGVRAVGGARLGARPRDRAARRSVRHRHGAALRRPRSRTSTTSRCSRTHADVFRRFAAFDVLANNADRKGGHCLPATRRRHDLGHRPRPDVPPRREAAHGHLGLRRRAASRRRSSTTCVGPPRPRRTWRSTARRGCCRRSSSRRSGSAPTTCCASGTLPDPDPGYHSLPWPLV